MHYLLQPAGKRAFLLGNAAVVRGALEAGVGFASTYPGTPASEIGDSFSELAAEAGIYFEYSVNEKVATEAAAGAALSGIRSLVAFKHFGFNVASDSIFPLAYIGIRAGLVIVFADDPQCWSSGQSEQDSRAFAKISHLPMLEPSDAAECKEFTKLAFEISEKLGSPVLLRLTTRVAHASGGVLLGELKRPAKLGKFEKGREWRTMPPVLLSVHSELHSKMEKAIALAKKYKLNRVFKGPGKAVKGLGLVASGVGFDYAVEACEHIGISVPIFKLGLTWPLDEDAIAKFMRGLKQLLVIEELEGFLETEVKRIAQERGLKIKIFGKELLSHPGELNIEKTATALAKLLGKANRLVAFYSRQARAFKKLKLLPRWPVLCPGCPHRASFYAVKQSSKGCIFGGDIGCYILGIYPPFKTQDFVISMGASLGFCHGIAKRTDQQTIAFVGDSTFFHAAIPGLINTTYNKTSPLIIVLDNRSTAMTGHQPNPGTGKTGMGEQTKELSIAEIAKACGVNYVDSFNPYNLKEAMQKIENALKLPGNKLLVAKQECRLQFIRRARAQGLRIPVFEIDQNKCTKCGKCVYEFACPAIAKKGAFEIDPEWCWGCSVCAQICPAGAIAAR